MTNLISIQVNEQQEPIVSARELHKVLEVKKHFTDWWEQQQNYGFEENQDFAYTPVGVNVGNGATRRIDDYVMKLDMAKELAMVMVEGMVEGESRELREEMDIKDLDEWVH